VSYFLLYPFKNSHQEINKFDHIFFNLEPKSYIKRMTCKVATQWHLWQIIDYLQQQVKDSLQHDITASSFWYNMKIILDSRGELFVISDHQDHVLAYAVIDKYAQRIELFEVLSQYRGQKYGTKLVKFLIELKDWECRQYPDEINSKITLNSLDDSIDFWIKQGFKISEQNAYHGETKLFFDLC
jgi:hypothetical protein